MKKLLVLLLIATLAAFIFAGCSLIPSEGEGEGEGEGEPEPTVTVEVSGSIEIGGVTYVKGGVHDITVTFSAPVAGYANVFLYPCTGDYSKEKTIDYAQKIILFPDAERKVWTGSGFFGCCEDDRNGNPCYPGCSDCCAQIIEVEVGECDWCYYAFPVIVDSAAPEIDLQVRFVDCDPCDPCGESAAVRMEWSSLYEDTCDVEDCCADDCTGVGSWTMTIEPNECAGPCEVITGTGCPVEGESNCLCLKYSTDPNEDVSYTITFEMADLVGNAIAKQSWTVWLDTDEVTEFNGNTNVGWDTDKKRTDWLWVEITGICESVGD